jgi:hypothetical protein
MFRAHIEECTMSLTDTQIDSLIHARDCVVEVIEDREYDGVTDALTTKAVEIRNLINELIRLGNV